ncbi:sensor histidine kinase [Corynebacterium sp. AOP40-9SA-29]|uniref:sensor histidine kinase n=1 Tax=Corynebacterium sp. AOP40-9SA-29 TaxID=3457677 RepID=UPI004033B306
MNSPFRAPHRPNRLLRILRASRITQLGVAETVLAVALTAFEFMETSQQVSMGTAIYAAITLALIAGTAKFPAAVSILSLLMVLSSFVIVDLIPMYSIFFTMLIVEILAASGQILLAGSLAFAHWVLAAVDPVARALMTDVVSLTVVGIMLAAALLLGYTRDRHQRQQKDMRVSLAEQEREQRLELARELHDSVATSLTSVVMQSQALTLLPPGEEHNHRQSLENISESSREALANLRTMLQLLNEKPNRVSFRTRTASPPLDVAISRMEQELEAHSLQLRARVELPPGIAAVLNDPAPADSTKANATAWADRDTVIKVLTEMTSNAAKHSSPHATIHLECTVDHDVVEISMTNPTPRPTPPDELTSGGMGLGSMRARATKAGGTLTARLHRGRTGDSTVEAPELPGAGGGKTYFWRTTLRLPIVVTKS